MTIGKGDRIAGHDGGVTDRYAPPISAPEQAAKDARRALIERAAVRLAAFKADEAVLLRDTLDAAAVDPQSKSNIRGALTDLGLA